MQSPTEPLDMLRRFLGSVIAVADTPEEIDAWVRRRSLVTPWVVDDAIEGIEAVLAAPPPGDALARMVAQDGNWSLPDASGPGAAQSLGEVLARIRRVRTEPPSG